MNRRAGDPKDDGLFQLIAVVALVVMGALYVFLKSTAAKIGLDVATMVTVIVWLLIVTACTIASLMYLAELIPNGRAMISAASVCGYCTAVLPAINVWAGIDPEIGVMFYRSLPWWGVWYWQALVIGFLTITAWWVSKDR